MADPENTCGQALGKVRRLDNGNVELAIGYASIEFTPAHVDALVRQLLRAAHPREHMFVIPVEKEAGHV